jgi:Metalloenzyme superfamily
MMQYDGDLKLPERFLVPPPAIDKVSGQYLARNGITTFACSETQKFGHVTFFWNGNRSGYFDEGLETYVEVRCAVPSAVVWLGALATTHWAWGSCSTAGAWASAWARLTDCAPD